MRTRQNGQPAWVVFRRSRKHRDSTQSFDISSIAQGCLFTPGQFTERRAAARIGAAAPGLGFVADLISFEMQRRRNRLAARSRGTRERYEICRSSIRNSAATN